MQSWWNECYAVSPHVFIVNAVVFNFTTFCVTKIASLFCIIKLNSSYAGK